MNDLDDLLRHDAHRWQTPPVAPPDLDAALARSRARRGRLLAAGALVAVVALGAGVAVLTGPPAIPAVPAVPDPMRTPTTSPRPAPSESVPAIGEVAAAVRARAAEQGIVVGASAVRATWREVAAILPIGGSGPAGDIEVWLAQVDGEFSCDQCQSNFTGPEASSSYLFVVLDAHSLKVLHLEGNGDSLRLADLGEPVRLDIG